MALPWIEVSRSRVFRGRGSRGGLYRGRVESFAIGYLQLESLNSRRRLSKQAETEQAENEQAKKPNSQEAKACKYSERQTAPLHLNLMGAAA